MPDNLKRRLSRVEARTPPANSTGGAGRLALEIREIDREIASLEREIAEREALMSPEELEESTRRVAPPGGRTSARLRGPHRWPHH